VTQLAFAAQTACDTHAAFSSDFESHTIRHLNYWGSPLRLALFLLSLAICVAFVSRASAGEMWISAQELAQLPMEGEAWDDVLAAADGNLEPANVSGYTNNHDVECLAVALVYARTGSSSYRQKAADEIVSAIGTETSATAHSIGRNLVSLCLAADLIDLATFDASMDGQFRTWIDGLRYMEFDDGTVVEESESRANNHGTHAAAGRTAIAVYLNDTDEIARCAQVFKGWLGDRDSYSGYSYTHDMSWQANEALPVPVNPAGAMNAGQSISGVLPEEMRRGCGFQWPPCYTNYPWEALQGVVVEAFILSRLGYDVWNWEDEAILRAAQFLYDLSVEFPNDPWWAPGDDKNTGRAAKNIGWTDWTRATPGIASDADRITPMRFRLYGAYPNPFNPRTTLRFDTPAANHIDLSVYDAAGRRVRTLRSGVIPQGRWSIVWDGTDEHGRQLASGVYFVKLLSGKFLGTSKTILMR
jgi:hypothetical protein